MRVPGLCPEVVGSSPAYPFMNEFEIELIRSIDFVAWAIIISAIMRSVLND